MTDYGWSVIQGILVSPIQRMVISSALHAGQSANAALRALSAAGMGIRRTVGLQIAREIRGIEKAGYTYQYIRQDYKLADEKIPVSSQIMRDNYKYWGNVKTRITDTSEESVKYFTFSHADNLTRRELEEIAAEIVDSALSTYGEELEDIHITGVARSG